MAKIQSRAESAPAKRDLARRSGRLSVVWGETRRGGCGVENPDFTVGKVGKQRREILVGSIVRPDDSGVVDVGRVVHPLIVVKVILRVTNDNEVVARDFVEVRFDARAGPFGLVTPASNAESRVDTLVDANGDD